MGWEPTYEVLRDSRKRIIGYRPEVEWDETEREWMRALADYEAGLCPLCGLPRSVCQTPEAEFGLHADVSICWATAHMQESMRQWQDSNKTSPARNALVAHLTD